MFPTPPLRQQEWRLLIGLFLLALVPRLLFIHFQVVPSFDPWRHLALVRNLRAGLGFTLFDGQPYLWYSPLWYRLCAALPPGLGMDWLAALCSALAAPLLYLALCRSASPLARGAPWVAAGLLALSGPAVAYTCHYGAEGAALALCLLALALVSGLRSSLSALVAGLAFGTALVLRLNFAVTALLFLPLLRRPAAAALFGGGAALPLVLTWWRNRGILAAHPWVFTWDGLATRSSEFDLLSTVMLQLHPDLQEGLRRLHERIVPLPEWIATAAGPSWGLLTFMAVGLAALLACRRPLWLLTAGLALAYFLLGDRSHSSNFFRVYLPLFPLFCMAVAQLSARLFASPRRVPRALAVALPLLLLAGGARLWIPDGGVPLARVTPPAGLLAGERYLVNSTYFHPESLIYRYPERSFLGLPLRARDLDPFLEAFPAYRSVLWHDFGVQEEVRAALQGAAGFEFRRRESNGFGLGYTLLERATSGSGQAP